MSIIENCGNQLTPGKNAPMNGTLYLGGGGNSSLPNICEVRLLPSRGDDGVYQSIQFRLRVYAKAIYIYLRLYSCACCST